jgi:anti-anti-sigma factor
MHEGVCVISIKGELDLSTAPTLEDELEGASSSGVARLLIDFSDCEFIDSTGIALIVRTWQRIDADRGSGSPSGIVLCCLTDQVRRLFDITGIESSIPTYRNRDEALAVLR